jgi:hypothetical protein
MNWYVSMTIALHCNTSASICSMILSSRTIDFSEHLMVRCDDWVAGMPVGSTRFRFPRRFRTIYDLLCKRDEIYEIYEI